MATRGGAVLASILHPMELWSLATVKLQQQNTITSNLALNDLDEDTSASVFCWSALQCVSRSFARVIQTLPEELRDPVCVFYLVLRALDTIEDDMTLDSELKNSLLIDFHQRLDGSKSNKDLLGIGEADEKTLLMRFSFVQQMFMELQEKYRNTITDTCQRMALGMSEFSSHKSVDSVNDYDLYCHYVAGLVGVGLTTMFEASELERNDLSQIAVKQANSMGLFLQKTNIVRDFLEDFNEGRTFWPSEITSRFDHDRGLKWFVDHPQHADSIACLNALVHDALRHLPDCLKYLSLLKNKKIFEFCAVPQVMAIATLAKVCNNAQVFYGAVKIRKGLAARIMLTSRTHDEARMWMKQFASVLSVKLNTNELSSLVGESNAVRRTNIPSLTVFAVIALATALGVNGRTTPKLFDRLASILSFT